MCERLKKVGSENAVPVSVEGQKAAGMKERGHEPGAEL